MRFATTLTAVFLLSGCTYTSSQEPRQYGPYTYDLAGPTKVLQAWENVFRLADGEDVTFIRPAASGTHEQLQINHSWLITTGVTWHWGTDTYTILAVPMAPLGTSLQISGVRNSNSISARWHRPMNRQAMYNMLDARARYFLGETEEWRSCDIQELLEQGALDPICSFTSDDHLPPTLER